MRLVIYMVRADIPYSIQMLRAVSLALFHSVITFMTSRNTFLKT